MRIKQIWLSLQPAFAENALDIQFQTELPFEQRSGCN
jgi:hypothetical protein